MGKIRVAALGDEQAEKEQAKKAETRREAKKAKKAANKTEDVTVATPDAATSVQENSDELKKDKRVVKQKVHSKRYQEVAAMINKKNNYALTEAVSLVKKTSKTKFDSTVEIHINLNPMALNGKDDFRGSVNFPHGTGKKINIAIVDEEVLKKLETGVIDFDILLAHPSMMAKIAKYARVLGPKGLMPNPKNGTVTDQPEKRAKELTGGLVNFKTEPTNPILHLSVGKVSFEETKLKENISALVKAIGTSKIYKVTITSTMGPGINVDVTTI